MQTQTNQLIFCNM